MDSLSNAFSASACLRVLVADVTVAAKALEARHLSGPTASAVLAESLVAVALLSADAASPEEAVSLRLHTNGPVRGVWAEGTGEGNLRGFTNVKILNDLDGIDPISTDSALGSAGSFYIVRSLPGKILGRSALSAVPPCPRNALARYFNVSMQVPTGVAVRVRADCGGLVYARGLLVQKMPDGSTEAFVNVLERFEDGSAGEALAKDESIPGFRDLFSLPDLENRETRPLQFHCRCDREKTLAALSFLPIAELQSMVDQGVSQRIFCHMCSREFSATSGEIESLLKKKAV